MFEINHISIIFQLFICINNLLYFIYLFIFIHSLITFYYASTKSYLFKASLSSTGYKIYNFATHHIAGLHLSSTAHST